MCWGRLLLGIVLALPLMPGTLLRAQPLALLAPLESSPVSEMPEIDASSYVLLDAATGRTLAASAADSAVPPASLTKLMTAYVVFEALRDGTIALDDEVLVSARAWRMKGSRMFIEVDTRVAVEELLQGLIVHSGNDASVALAEHVAGSVDAFVARMNERAATLGLVNSQFRNPTGLPAEGHYSTAADIGRVARALVLDFPEHYHRFSQREFTYNSIRQHNRNRLLWRDPSVDGLKTGYTVEAGYCLVSSALRDELRLIAVVLGSRTNGARDRGTRALLEYGFLNYERRRLFTAGDALASAPVQRGEAESLGLGLMDDLYVTLAKGRRLALTAELEIPEHVIAPIAAGAPLGRVKVMLGEEELAAVPLVALGTVAPAAGWSRFMDGFGRRLDE